MASLETQYAELSRAANPGSFDQQLQSLRQASAQALVEKQLPSRKVEGWRQANLQRISEQLYTPVGTLDTTLVEPLPSVSVKNRLRVINGEVQSAVTTLCDAHLGLKASALATGEEFPAELIGSVAKGRGSSLVDLNGALFNDALSLSFDSSYQSEQYLQVQYHAVSGSHASLSAPRTIIEVRSGATVNLVQQFIGEHGADHFSSAVTEVILHEGATLNHIVLQEEQLESSHFHALFIHQGAASSYNAIALSPGAALSRNDIVVDLAGDGAKNSIRGLFVGTGSRAHNSDITMNHRAKNCASQSLFKGIGAGSSHGVFRGLVHVTEEGAGTDAEQSFKSLLLNDSAKIHTEPQLLIYNDDVKCSHGATIGQLDEKQLFYLESRGLDPLTAKKFLIDSFAADVVAAVKNEALVEALLKRVHEEVLAVSH